MSTKKMDVPDIGNLLGRIADKRQEQPKAVIQHVQPIDEESNKDNKTLKRENSKEFKSLRVKTLESQRIKEAPKIGRPSDKRPDIEYVKISPKIPRDLKKQVDLALVIERLRDGDGNAITTLDGCVAWALELLIRSK
jgi:hypothetical protein